MHNLSGRRFFASSLASMIFAAAFAITSLIPLRSSASDNVQDSKKIVDQFGKLPLLFEKNSSQADPSVKYLSRGKGYNIFFSPGSALVTLNSGTANFAVKMDLAGADKSAEISGIAPQGGKVNYFKGSDSSKWQTDVATYGKVAYKDVYPKTDLIYYGTQDGKLEYDFVLAPGADVSKIGFDLKEFDGKISISEKGDLAIGDANGEICFHAPYSYQVDKDGNRTEVKSEFVVADRQISFKVGDYDKSKTLVIDPFLQYSSFIGGSDADFSYGFARDSSGNTYICGYTKSANFPVTSSAYDKTYSTTKPLTYDAFVLKMNPDGTKLLYSTFIGGSKDETYPKIALDSDGNAYVAIQTSSANFPTTPGAYHQTYDGLSDATAVFKLKSTGSLVFSTYLSLSGNNGDYPSSIALDSSNNVYVAGKTYSANFPTQAKGAGTVISNAINGASDAFLSKLSPDGQTLLLSTFLGGSSDDNITKIVIHAGQIFIGGYTKSSDFPKTLGSYGANYDIFIAQVADDFSSLVFSRLIPGNDGDYLYDMTMDSSGNIYVCGATWSSDFPTTAGVVCTSLHSGGYDAFVTKLNSDASSIVYSTYIGGTSNDYAFGIAVDPDGNAIICGQTNSTNFPVTATAYNSTCQGDWDAFLLMLNSDATAIRYSSYIGSSGIDILRSIILDNGLLYAIGYTAGGTAPDTFPTTAGAYDKVYNGGAYDTVLMAFDLYPVVTFKTGTGGTLDGTTTQSLVIGSDCSAVTANATPPYKFFSWTSPDGFSSTDETLTLKNVTDDTVVTANFAPATATLTMKKTGTGTVTPASGSQNTLDDIAIAATPGAMYHFVNWTASNDKAIITDPNAASTKVQIGGNVTVTANFARDTATLTMSKLGPDTCVIVPAVGDSTVNTGTAIPLKATAGADWHFKGWRVVSGTPTIASPFSATTTVTIDPAEGHGAKATVECEFEHNKAELTMATSGGGSGTTSASATIDTKTEYSISATPTDSGSDFVKWTISPAANGTILDVNNKDTKVTLTGPATVTANFAVHYWTVSFVADPAKGTLSGDVNQLVAHHASASAVIAVPNDTSHFVGWNDPGSTMSRILVLEDVTSDTTVTASFLIDTTYWYIGIVGSSGATAPGDGLYRTWNVGSEINPLTATPADGTWDFICWTIEGNATIADVNSTSTTGHVYAGNPKIFANFWRNNGFKTLSNGVADYPALAADHRDLYKIVLPAGQSYLKITNSVTGTGDCDYYLKPGTPPTTRDYYAKDDRIGNDVNIEVKNPTPGTWYLMLYAKTDFIGQTYQADWAADTYPQPPFVTANLTDPLDKVKISWPAVAGATDYAIYRSDVNSTEYASQLAVCDIGTDPVIYYDEFNGVNFHYYWVKTNKGPDESAFSNVASIAKTDLATQKILTNGKAVSGINGKGGYTYKYVFTVPGGQNLLEIRTFGGTGNCDLTVERFGDATFNGYSVNEGNNESIIINDPAGDTYYIYLYGKTDFSKVTLFAKYYNTAPIPPTGVMASDGTFENKVVVNWKASPGAASYLIYRNTTNDSGNAKFLAEIPDTTYQDLSVASDTYATYYYWVKAKNTKGTSAISSKGDSGYPTRYAAPTATVTASDGTYFDKVRITWASVPGATSYEISRNTSETLIGSTLCSTVAFNNTKKTYTYDVTGDNLTSSIGPWYFFVQPKNANGFSTAKHDQGSLNLAGPAGVKATDGTLYKRTKITWTAVPGAAHYYVYRTTDNTLDNVEKGFGPIQPPLTECYDDTPDMDGTPHYYWVQAADAGENYFSDYSLCDVGWSKTDFTTLPAPSLKSVSNGIEDKVTVTWGEVAAANKYELWRADVPSTTGAGLTQIGSSLSSTTLSAEDTSGTDWVTYYYFVKSTNSTLGLPAGVSSIKPGMKTSKINDIPADTDALTGGLDSRTLYKFDVIPGVSRFVINLTGTGCELYTKFGSAPSRKSFYAKGTVTSPTSQIISIANPSGGTWYILLYGTAVYSDVYMDTYQTSPQQINITAEPLNGFTAPFTAVFKGTITDGSNNAVPNIDFTVRDPQTGLLTWLKSDKKGYWTYSPVIRTEGVHTFDFYLGGATDIQRTSYSVYTLKQAYEPSKQYFDYAGYFRASYSLQTSDDLVKAQWLEFLDIRNGYVTGKTPDGTYTYNWYNESGYNSITDQNLAAKLKSGLYIAYYGFEGAGFGITPFPGYSELKFTPLLVRISEAKLDEVLPKAIGLKLIDENQKGVVDNGGICVITLTPYSNPNEGGPSTFKLKLTAKQQFELLTNLLSGDSAFVSEAKNDFDENILQRLYDVKLDNGYRTIRLMNFTFTK